MTSFWVPEQAELPPISLEILGRLVRRTNRLKRELYLADRAGQPADDVAAELLATIEAAAEYRNDRVLPPHHMLVGPADELSQRTERDAYDAHLAGLISKARERREEPLEAHFERNYGAEIRARQQKERVTQLSIALLSDPARVAELKRLADAAPAARPAWREAA